MNIHLTLIVVILIPMHEVLATNVMPELKKNVLNSRYGANFKYEGMLTLSFDRLYVVAKYEIPKIENVKFTTFSFDLMCNHLNISKKSYLLRYIRHCRRIAPYVKFYKQQIDYYNQTTYNILQNEIGLILPSFNNNNNRKKRFLSTILGTIASKDTMIMYGKYNSDTLMDLIKTVHQMQNVTTWKEEIFVSEMNEWIKNKLAHIHNEFDYSIDAVLFLTTIREKYVRMYEKFIAELRFYSKAIRILSKGYLPITLITPSKLEAILKQVQIAIAKPNQDYELVLNKLYLYYDMKLVMFGIDSQRNLIIQFPVSVQPYTQTKLTLK